jgi:arylsulfatase
MKIQRSKSITKSIGLFAFITSAVLSVPGLNSVQAADKIVHDGEYNFLRTQHGEKWDKEDVEIDRRLAEIRERNGGKRPNILYILIDDVSFGQMGNRTMNYVTGIDTSNINEFAKQSMTLMRMYTEPSCTPTRAAMLTGRHPVRSHDCGNTLRCRICNSAYRKVASGRYRSSLPA